MIRKRLFRTGHTPVATLGLIAALTIVGCTQIPELDATIPDHLRDAPYPQLIALDKTFATRRHPREQANEIEDGLTARRAGLQARAKALNDPVLDPATRKRMADGVGR